MKEVPLLAAPHAHDKVSVQRTMGLVLVALLPALLFGLYQFGWPAIFLLLVTLTAALALEAASLRIAGKPQRPFLLDGSVLLTGVLLAMTLPPWAPWWIGVVGAFVAVIVGKHVFGGLGQNLFNPAMVARVALLVSFPLQMTAFTAPAPLFSGAAPGFAESAAITFGGADPSRIDAVSSATPLGHAKTELGRGALLTDLDGLAPTWQLAAGSVPGSLGETSAVLLLLGGLFLLYRRVITWHIPLALLGTLALCAAVFHWYDPARYLDPFTHLASGAALLAAFFIATDPVTSPVSVRGQLLFGAGCGLLIYVIRTFAAYPEGVAFAVMLMNACVPLIDRYLRPRIYGRDRRGRPLGQAGRGAGR
jgi:electron transport complex protein RnfD